MGKLLAMLVAEQRVQTSIPCITNSQGTLLSDPNDILDTFVDYYCTLYMPIPGNITNRILNPCLPPYTYQDYLSQTKIA